MLTLLLVPTVAFAIIGDDVDKVMKDYGSPFDASNANGDTSSLKFYVKDGGVAVTFLNGTSQCEVYTPRSGDMPDSKVREIFKQNGHGSQFKVNQQLSSADRTVWESADKKLIAYVPKHGDHRGCLVATRDYINFLAAQPHPSKPE